MYDFCDNCIHMMTSTQIEMSSTPTFDHPMDNLLKCLTLFKILQTHTSPKQINRARRATAEFFYMNGNLLYGQEARDYLDQEDLLTIRMPLDLMRAVGSPCSKFDHWPARILVHRSLHSYEPLMERFVSHLSHIKGAGTV
jgi:hypothetical protein